MNVKNGEIQTPRVMEKFNYSQPSLITATLGTGESGRYGEVALIGK